MTDDGHIRAFRLFELARAENVEKDFKLQDGEKEHLQECADCQGVIEVFARQFSGRPLVLPDRNSPPTATPRFNIGDHVTIIGPGNHQGGRGMITSIVEPKAGDFVYRYRVHFIDGGSHTFFGFEIELSS